MSLLDNLPHVCTIQRRTRTASSLGGSASSAVIEQTGVACWVQQAGTSEAKDYEKRGMRVNRKVYFTERPNVTERHELIITAMIINGQLTTIPEADQIILTVKTEPRPDASAGLGVLYKVMAEELTNALT